MIIASKAPSAVEKMKRRLRGGSPLAFPLPSLLPLIEDLLQDVQYLDGLILVTDSDKVNFVSFSQIDQLLRSLRKLPKGAQVAEKLYIYLLQAHGKGAAKPVLVFYGKTSFWLGMIAPCISYSCRQEKISHLNRCFALHI